MKNLKRQLISTKTIPEIMINGIDHANETEIANVPVVSISITRNLKTKDKITYIDEVVSLFKDVIGDAIDTQEYFLCVYLNPSLDILSVYRHAVGSSKSVLVDIQIILLGAIKQLANSIIVAHNHPSGTARPSKADIELTKQLQAAANTQGLSLLDHVIIAKDEFYSIAKNQSSHKLSLSGISFPLTVKETQKPNHKMTTFTFRNPNNLSLIQEQLASGNLPPIDAELQKDIDVLRDLTDNFTDFSDVENDNELAAFTNQVIDDLNNLIFGRWAKENGQEIPEKKDNGPKASKPKQEKKEKKQRQPHEKKQKAVKPTKEKKIKMDVAAVENILPEVRIIKRYLALDGKKVTKQKILTLISGLQRLIRTHAIRKTSIYADEIMRVQKELIKVWNKHKHGNSQFEVNLEHDDIALFDLISKGMAQMDSIRLIKQYFSIQGRENVIEKAKSLLSRIQKNKSISDNDKYREQIDQVTKSLSDYIDKKTDTPELTEQELNGFNGLGLIDYGHNVKVGDKVKAWNGSYGTVTRDHGQSIEIDSLPGHYLSKKQVRLIPEKKNDCPCLAESGEKCLNGLESPEGVIVLPEVTPDPIIETEMKKPNMARRTGTVNSMDLSDMNFETVGFRGKWLQLIGDPSERWNLMVWSGPGKGKSTLMIQLAKYLASVHRRKVLYVSKEEGIGATLKDKFIRMDALDPLITISTEIPSDLTPYQYVFIDSVTDLELTYEDLARMRDKFTSVNFMFIFQATGDGNYRGEKKAEHLVDVSVNVTDDFRAFCRKSRFGGKLSIPVFDPNFVDGVYKFPTMEQALRFRERPEGENMGIVFGDDGKYWVASAFKTRLFSEKGFDII